MNGLRAVAPLLAGLGLLVAVYVLDSWAWRYRARRAQRRGRCRAAR